MPEPTIEDRLTALEMKVAALEAVDAVSLKAGVEYAVYGIGSAPADPRVKKEQ